MQLTPADVSSRLTVVRNTAPLVQCITNAVVMNFTANALLAVGCAPAMVDIPEEAGPFAGVASALLINLGTPYAEQRAAMPETVQDANAAGVPWVLDPVAVGSLPVRTELAAELLEYRPTAIRGNPSEIIALAGTGTGGRGVDAVHTPADALSAAQLLARRHDSVVAVSGATDIVTDGESDMRLHNGHELLAAITGGGCALGTLMAAFVGADSEQPLPAVAAAVAVYTIAAEQAAVAAEGPGTFVPRLLDALHNLDAAAVAQRLAVS